MTARTPFRREGRLHQISRFSLALSLVALLSACGGGTGGSAPGEPRLDEPLDEVTQALRRRPPHQPVAPSFSGVTATSVVVSWVTPRFGETDELERAPDAGGAPGAFAIVASTDVERHVDATLSPATTYWYRVRSGSASGWSTYSPAARVTTAAAAAEPTPVATEPAPAPSPVPPPTDPTVAEPIVTPPGTTLREAAARRGILFGHGWGPPPWTIDERIAAGEFDTYALPGYASRIWKGPGVYDWSMPDFGVQYAEAHPGVRYGSTQLLYGTFLGQGDETLVPRWLRGPDSATFFGAPTVSPEQLSLLMRDFIFDYVQRYGSGCHRTEIANELVSWPENDFFYVNSSVGRAGGKTVAQYVDQLARWAKAANPNVKLFLNETRNEDSQTPSGTANAFGVLVRELAAMGTPLDGLGFQCHQRPDVPYDYASIEGVFRYFASLGYDLHLTEVGIAAPVDANGLVSAADQQRQADRYRALVGAFLRGAGPRARSISTWGTTDVNAYDRGGLLFDVNGQKKAAYHAVLDLLNQP